MTGILRKRANLPQCSELMVDVMQQLREADGFIRLNDVHGKTLRSLLNRDWIICSFPRKNPNDKKYKLTNRGQKALEIYEIPPDEYDLRRFDNICCRCGERERGVFKSGNPMPYCKPCFRRMQARRYRLFGYQKKHGVCPRCNERQKHVTKTGRVRSYCVPCRREMDKHSRKQRNNRLVERARNGEVFLCYGCKEKPRQLTKNWLQDYCEDCIKKQKELRKRANKHG